MTHPRASASLYLPTLLALALTGCAPDEVDSTGDSVRIDSAAPVAAMPVAAKSSSAPSSATDNDGDGYSTTDCDDTNANVHPGATETDNQTDDDCDGWKDEDFVSPGDVIVTEITRQARLGGSSSKVNGSWIEVYNRSSRTVNLANWVFARGTNVATNSVTIDPAAAPVLAAGEYAVFCDTDDYVASATASYPLACDYVWGDETQSSSYVGTYHNNKFYLRRDTDGFGLYIGGSATTGTKVDSVVWTYNSTNGYWPRNARFSTSLDPLYYDDTDNDDEANWCSTTVNSTGALSYDPTWSWYDVTTSTRDEYGTPGALNYYCGGDLDGDTYTTDDCDDTDAAVNPGATEVCNGYDDDCDGSIDEGIATSTYYADADGDGYGNPLVTTTGCTAPTGYVANNSDCDDTSASSSPVGTEVCDGVDNDCDGTIDDGITTGSNTFYEDADADSYGDATSSTLACTAPSGYTADATDCDDLDPDINPGATELDNGLDDDCDGAVDETFVAFGDLVINEIFRQARFGGSVTVSDGTWVEVYNGSSRTVDLAAWTIARGTSSSGKQIALDPTAAPILFPGDYVVFCDTDNYQNSAGVAYPLTCDYVWGDETQASTYVGTYHDNTFALSRDSDAFAVYADGNRTTGVLIDSVSWTYDATNGYWPRDARFSTSLDASFRNATSNDDEAYWCSTTANASGVVSNNNAYRWYDGSTTNDEHGTPGAANYDCLTDTDSDGYTGADDCDETNAAVNIGATEVCGDGIDNDCDGVGDVTTTWYADGDGDAYGDTAVSSDSCAQPSGYVADNTDCLDTDNFTYPGAPEACDGVDNDSDGLIDDGATGSNTYYADADGDTYGDAGTSVTGSCTAPTGYVADNTDCDDAAGTVNPGEAEVCNDGIDNDCDAGTTCEWGGSQKVSDNYDFRCYGDVVSYAVGTSIADDGDFDGDGYDDVVVGHGFFDNTGTDNGRAMLFYGPVNADQLIADRDLTINGDATANGDQFGSSSHFMGDLNGDGADELMVSAWKNGSDDRGTAYLFLGADAPTSYTDAWATFSTGTANDFTGQAIDAGDIDGNGTPDVMVGAHGRSSNAGVLGVWNSSAIGGGAEALTTDATFVITGVSASDTLGYAAVMREDVDGDGNADLLIGAPASSSTTVAGTAYLFYGVDSMSGTQSASTADGILTGGTAADRFGLAVAMLGDTDFDGQNDFVVTADKQDGAASDAGAAYVFTSAVTGSHTAASTATTTYRGEVASDFFGRSAAGIGDVNDDGYTDMMVGATAWDLGTISGAGAAYLFYGPFATGTQSASGYDAQFTGSNGSDAVGYAVAGGGDVNADGIPDFMISATSWDSFGLLNAGAAWLYYGGTL